MGKKIQILLLTAITILCVPAGYFIGKLVPLEAKKSKTAEKVVVEPEPVETQPVVSKSRVPELRPVSELERYRLTKGSSKYIYSFTVEASTETGDSLVFELYKDEKCQQLVTSNGTGRFSEIPQKADGKYYLRVTNHESGDQSEIKPIFGFECWKVVRLSKDEISKIMHKGTGSVDNVSDRIDNNNLKIQFVNISSDDPRPPKTLSEVKTRIPTIWQSVEILDLGYNEADGRLNYLKLKIIPNE